jgi:hypothetical protein
MYAAATWWRRVGRANVQTWPPPAMTLLAGLAAGASLAWRVHRRGEVVAAALARAVVAGVFHARRFASIHWAAEAFALAFAAQALM